MYIVTAGTILKYRIYMHIRSLRIDNNDNSSSIKSLALIQIILIMIILVIIAKLERDKNTFLVFSKKSNYNYFCFALAPWLVL